MQTSGPPTPESPAPVPSKRGLGFQLAAVGLVVVSALAGTGLARWLAAPPTEPTPPGQAGAARLQLDAWPKPTLAVVLTAQMHGYLLPCGCSRPQIGGLERRYNLVQLLKDKGWQLLPLDLGDVAQKEGPAKLPNIQGLIKYRYSMRAMKLMGYVTLGLGEYEASLPTFSALAEILNEPVPPLILGNLDDPKNNLRQAMEPHLARWRIVQDPASNSRLGVTAIIGSGVQAAIKDAELKLQDSEPALKQVAQEMEAAKLDYRILLYQGSLTRGKFAQGKDAEAVEVAKAFPQFDLVVALTEEEEPPANSVRVKHPGGKETLVLGVGHKGRYVGVLGLYKKPGGGFDTPRWELVQLEEKAPFLTTPDKEATHPVVNLLENYTKELKAKDYLAQVPQLKHPAQVAFDGKVPSYVGSERCKKCHERAYEIWEKTPHAHAYPTLETATRPSNRQYDPECIVCHTVGFGYHTGFRSADTTPLLKNVGCESCHGPCGDHVRQPQNADWYPVINPYRPGENETPEDKKKRLGRIDQFCQKCHDIDNDVHWSSVGFAAKWKKVEHPSLPPE